MFFFERNTEWEGLRQIRGLALFLPCLLLLSGCLPPAAQRTERSEPYPAVSEEIAGVQGRQAASGRALGAAVVQAVPTALSAGNAAPAGSAAPKHTPAANQEASKVRVKIRAGDTELIAVLEDNSTTRALIAQMPMTLPMMDLYGREMCYRYGAYALPTDRLRSDGYEVGDIAYWPPGGSLVILYRQSGERFERQHLGHIASGVEVFASAGDADVRFEVLDE